MDKPIRSFCRVSEAGSDRLSHIRLFSCFSVRQAIRVEDLVPPPTGTNLLRAHQKGIIRTFYSSRVIGSDLLFYFRIYNKVTGLAEFSQALPLDIYFDALLVIKINDF